MVKTAEFIRDKHIETLESIVGKDNILYDYDFILFSHFQPYSISAPGRAM